MLAKPSEAKDFLSTKPNDQHKSTASHSGANRIMGLRVIARLLSMLLAVLGIAMFVCLGWTLYYHETQTSKAFISAIAFTFSSALILYLWGRGSRTTIYRREALAVVGLGWILIGVYGALPYIFTGTLVNFSDAYFEATSGFTTTGATIIEDIEAVSHGVLFWRMMTHWLGGMGIIVLFTALFSQIGVGAKQLFRSETPGPITESLRPKIRETALTMWKIYTFLTVLLTGLLMICGMDFFDAICHGFSTMATGGYSTYNQSIGHFNNLAVELIVLLFMFIAGVNFTLYYQALHGNWRSLFRNSEFRVYLSLIILASLAITFNTYSLHQSDFLQSLRYASFQTVAILTGTGFGTDNFDAYPTLSKMILVCLMLVGGCAGSTTGGLKVSRIIVLFKVVYQEIYLSLRPQMRLSTRIGRIVVAPEVSRSILVFCVTFFLCILLGSLFMASYDLDMITATTAVIACLGNVGPGLADVGSTHTYAALPSGAKVFLSFCMLLGRLELTTLLVLLLPQFWRQILQE